MKGQAFQTLFLFIFLVAIATISSYILVDVYLKGAGATLTKLEVNQQQSAVPQFAIHDIEYSEYGSTAIVTFTLYNLGSTNILLRGWMIDFTDQNGNIICSTPIFESTADAANIGVSESVYDAAYNQTLTYGEAIPAHSVAEVNLTFIGGNCLNTTIDWSTTHLQMGFRVVISPTQYFDIMQCAVNPYTGYASCSSLGYQAYQ
ncbi:MAG: hypothetical protein ACP5GJ_03770 [Nanopusillaceae archaeon]